MPTTPPHAPRSADEFEFDPQASFEAIWGTGNVGIDDDDYGLVLFTMSDPDAKKDGDIAHIVAVVPFNVR